MKLRRHHAQRHLIVEEDEVGTPSPAYGPIPKLAGACGCPFGGRRPGPPRLMKAPVAGHALPQGGEG